MPSKAMELGSGTAIGHEAVKDAIGVRIETRDFARVINARNLGDFDSVIERCIRVVQEGISPGIGVEEVAVLAGGGVAVVTHRNPLIVNSENLGEHERGAGSRRV